ncbi:PREDICTED: E3 ubiquitin-protein ligase RNF123 [Myotis brandtii]|uniref:E3 ubiquitin-protein ligase RNF123 n=1 Tax=Myotis brandtii TaxID=109478 RepID=UPI000703E31A|nr:PREDICTED: E3 ubiquitin-protein ligase RNF123 [Myotis brandtii]
MASKGADMSFSRKSYGLASDAEKPRVTGKGWGQTAITCKVVAKLSFLGVPLLLSLLPAQAVLSFAASVLWAGSEGSVVACSFKWLWWPRGSYFWGAAAYLHPSPSPGLLQGRLIPTSCDSRNDPAAAATSRKPLNFQNLPEHLDQLLQVDSEDEESQGQVEGRLGPSTVVLDHTGGFEGLLLVDDDLLGVSEGEARWGSVCLPGLTWLFPGKWVYEVLISSQGLMQIGWCTINCRFNQEEGVGDTHNSYAYDGNRVRKWNVTTTNYGKAWAAGDIVSCLIDLDAGALSFCLNGMSLGTAFENLSRGPGMAYFPAISLSFKESVAFNFGSRPLRYPFPRRRGLLGSRGAGRSGWLQEYEVHDCLKQLMMALLRLYRFSPIVPDLSLQIHHLRLTVAILRHDKSRKFLLSNVLYPCVAARGPRRLGRTRAAQCGGLAGRFRGDMEVWGRHRACPQPQHCPLPVFRLGVPQIPAPLLPRGPRAGLCGLSVRSPPAPVVEELQVQILKLLLNNKDENGGEASRYIFLTKFRKFLQENASGRGNIPLLCPPEYMVCFLHRLISALRGYWDEYKASNPHASVSEEAYVPPQVFYNGKVDYFDQQRLGGLLSHLRKTLKDDLASKANILIDPLELQAATMDDLDEDGRANRFLSTAAVTLMTPRRPLSASEKVKVRTLSAEQRTREDSRCRAGRARLLARPPEEPEQPLTENSLLEVLDGAVMMYNLSVHQQLGKVSVRPRVAAVLHVGCMRVCVCVCVRAHMPRVCRGARLHVSVCQTLRPGHSGPQGHGRGPGPDRPFSSGQRKDILEELTKSQKVFSEKLDHLSRRLAWVHATVYSQEKMLDIYWLLRVCLRTIEHGDRTGPLFAFMPEFYLSVAINSYSALKNYFGPVHSMEELPGYEETLTRLAAILAKHFADTRIVGTDIRDSLMQALASYVCYPHSLRAVERIPEEQVDFSRTGSALAEKMLDIYWLLRVCLRTIEHGDRTGPLFAFMPEFYLSVAINSYSALKNYFGPVHSMEELPGEAGEGCGFGYRYTRLPHLLKIKPEDANLPSLQKPCPSILLQQHMADLLRQDPDVAPSFLNSVLNQLNWAFSEFIGMIQEVGGLGVGVLMIQEVGGLGGRGLESVDHYPILVAVTGILVRLLVHGPASGTEKATSVLLADPCFQLRSIRYLLGHPEPPGPGTAPPAPDRKRFSLQSYTDYISSEELAQVEQMLAHLTSASAQAAASSLPTSEEDLCPICYAHPISAVFQPCGHKSCKACINQHLMNNKDCFFCKATIESVEDWRAGGASNTSSAA